LAPSGASLVTTRQPLQQPLPTPPASSLIILTRQQLPHAIANSNSGSNPIFESGEQKHKYAMDMDMAYGCAVEMHFVCATKVQSSPR